MSNNEFESLIERRKGFVRSLKENKFDIDSILAGLYNDPSHFIYEILQNAEDAKDKKVRGAKKVIFKLCDDRLDIHHDGADFDFKDIEGVTGIGISKKKDDLTSIGKFGVGFKSVFAVTQTPYIFSGEYKIKIEDFVVPVPTDDSNVDRKNETLIRIPFNHNHRSREEIFGLIHKRLENLELRTLLFLKNIEEIQWTTPSTSGHYLKSSEGIQNVPGTKRVILISLKDTREYIVIERPIRVEDKELKVEVAYKLEKDKSGKEIVIAEPDSKLVVFFPTEKVTFLNFFIQGPYKTTPNRENIPLDDEQNKTIIGQTGCLVAESLSVIKKLGLLDTNFLTLLPIDPVHKESSQIYSVIYEKVKEKFCSNEELLPTIDGNYTKTSDCILARGKELAEFLVKDDILKLFDKQSWLDTDITSDKTSELRDYLISELKVTEVDFESFARRITMEFLQTKSDEWMIDFYSRLLDQQSLWSDRGYYKGILRAKPIIRLENNEHIAPCDDDGKVQVYLPTETKSQYKTVKHILTEHENALKFLKELGLTKPDLFAEIREFILHKYQIDNPPRDEWYLEDFEKLLKAYEAVPANKKAEFIGELSEASLIDSIKNDTAESRLCKPSETYFKDADLINFFDSCSVYFVSDELSKNFEDKKLIPFLTDLGVWDKPRRVRVESELTWEEKEQLRKNTDLPNSSRDKVTDYDLEGLESFVANPTKSKSLSLWKILTSSPLWYFEGKYEWTHYASYKRDVPFKCNFLKKLRRNDWLYDKNETLKKPRDITFSEVSDTYVKDGPNIGFLIKSLGFKPEIIEQLPETDKKILEITRKFDITPEELENLISERKEKPLEKEEEQWTPDCQPDMVTVRIQEIEPDKIATPDLSGQVGGGKPKGPPGPGGPVPPKTPLDRKAIGRWGEEYVYNALKEKYEKLGDIIETDSGFKIINAEDGEFEIIWLNKYQDKGKGYDFVITKNEIEMEYIEVKTKMEESGELIPVTGTQWEFAGKLFEQNVGEKYSFYVVSNAGKENAGTRILRNPIKLWKEGRLYAP